MQLIKNFLLKWGCLHNWYSYCKTKVTYLDTPDYYYTRNTLICKKCGKIKQIKL